MKKIYTRYYVALFIDYFFILTINNFIVPNYFEKAFNSYMQFFGLMGGQFSFRSGAGFHLFTVSLISFSYFFISLYFTQKKTPAMHLLKVSFKLKNDFTGSLNTALAQMMTMFSLGTIVFFTYFKNKLVEEYWSEATLVSDHSIYESFVFSNLPDATHLIFPHCPIESEALKKSFKDSKSEEKMPDEKLAA